jgi:hypothetical protein
VDLPGRRRRSAVSAFAERADHDARYFDFNFIPDYRDDGVFAGIFCDATTVTTALASGVPEFGRELKLA